MKLCCKKEKQGALKDARQKMLEGARFPLVLAGEGEHVQVVAMAKSKKIHERLLSMGIGIGDILQVVKCQGQGAVVVAKGGCRYTLGGGMAHKIFVR